MTEPRFDSVFMSGDPGGCMPGMVHLREFIFATWPKYRGDAGCYLHNGKTDSGNPSFHSRGRAIDIWIATGHSDVGTSIFDWCIAHRNDIGLNEVIFNRRIWRADNLSAGIHAYTVNAHTDHIHIALNLDGARGLLPFFGGSDAQPIPTAPLPEGDDDLTPDESKWLAELHKAHFNPGAAPHSILQDINTTVGQVWNALFAPANAAKSMLTNLEARLDDVKAKLGV